MRRLRGRRIAMVFQDPASYLNPLLAIGTQMEDAIRGQEAALGEAKRSRHAIRDARRRAARPRSASPSRSACSPAIRISCPAACASGC